MPAPHFVAIDGPIGVGKTTLARRLCRDLQGELVLEGPAENPFLQRFYAQPKEFALATQLFFLMQRAEQLGTLRQSDLFAQVRVADFLMDKDRLFAQLTLRADEYRLYDQIYTHVLADVPTPDVVVYLQAPVNILMQRIAARGIDYERTIDADYLERLAGAYRRHFGGYNLCPLIIVDAAEYDLLHNEDHYTQLVDAILTPSTQRRFIGSSPFE